MNEQTIAAMRPIEIEEERKAEVCVCVYVAMCVCVCVCVRAHACNPSVFTTVFLRLSKRWEAGG